MEKSEVKESWFPVKYRDLDTKEVNVAKTAIELPRKFVILITRYKPELKK